MKEVEDSNKIIFVTKDVLRKGDLPAYGNKYWKTPNIDKLAISGTMFLRHYTAASSTAMSVTAMFSGKYPLDSKQKYYTDVKDEEMDHDTLFNKLESLGYECHIIWPVQYENFAKRYATCFRTSNCIVHNLDIAQRVGVRSQRNRKIIQNNSDSERALASIDKELESIASLPGKVFAWMHIPHVLAGRCSYGSDIDLLDRIIGYCNEKFKNNVILTADHGHMNYEKNKLAYGFDVYETTISVPFISPRISNSEVIDFPTSHIDLKSLIIDKKVVKRDLVISDTAYYAQPHRKIAIISGKYKYIYNKINKKEELYDLDWDVNENANLLVKEKWDTDRYMSVNVEEMFYYPYWAEAEEYYKRLKEAKDKVWRKGTGTEELIGYIEAKLKALYKIMQKFIDRLLNRNWSKYKH